MLLRVLFVIAALAGTFGITAWAVAPGGGRDGARSLPKGDRLAAQVASVADESADPALAEPTPAFAAPVLDVALFTPNAAVVAAARPEQGREPAAKDSARGARKPFKCPRVASVSPAPLTAAQIARIKAALNLSPEQEKHWRPVEAGLMDMARRLETARAGNGTGKVVIPAERTQQLYLTAGPLVLSLREEQKRDARNLACSLGFATLAALI